MSRDPLDTVIQALAAGDYELVRVHAQHVLGWLEELKRLRIGEPPCSACGGSGVMIFDSGPERRITTPCFECNGEGKRRASTT